MPAPSWVEDVRRTKIIGRPKPDENERLCGAFKELRVRYIKVVGDNIILRNALAAKKRRRPERYEQEQEITPGASPDDYHEDLCEYSERLERDREDW